MRCRSVSEVYLVPVWLWCVLFTLESPFASFVLVIIADSTHICLGWRLCPIGRAEAILIVPSVFTLHVVSVCLMFKQNHEAMVLVTIYSSIDNVSPTLKLSNTPRHTTYVHARVGFVHESPWLLSLEGAILKLAIFCFLIYWLEHLKCADFWISVQSF